MGKNKKKIILLIIGLSLASILTIVLIAMIPVWINKHKANQILKEQCKVYELNSLKQIKKKMTEEEKQADYSDDGMTNIEKINKGLSIYSDDTDGDGLRDVDEINIYKSDPLKYSTAGDLYSDYYKVNNNLNVKKKIKEVPNIDIGVENIKLTPKVATDEKATYQKYNGKIPSDYDVIEEPFIINGFTGEVKFTLKEEAKNCEVYSYDRLKEKVNKIKSKSKGNDIIFKNADGDPILITYKTSYIKNTLKNSVESKLNYIDKEEENQKKDYYIVTSFLLNIFAGRPIEIYETTNSPTKIVEKTDKNFQDGINQAIQEYFKNTLNKTDYKVMKKLNVLKINVRHTYIGEQVAKFLEKWAEETEINLIKKYQNNNVQQFISSLFFKVYKVNGTKQEIINSLLGEELKEYVPYDLIKETEMDIKNEENKVVADSGFDMKDNSFHFQNLATKVGDGGICAGMAYMVSNAYNNNKVIEKADVVPEYNPFNYETPTFDISDSEKYGCITSDNKIGEYTMGDILQSYSNATIEDNYYNSSVKKGLSEISIIDANLYEGEDIKDIKLIKAIEYYFAYLNNETFILQSEIEKLIGKPDKKHKFSEIEGLIDYLNDGNVAICALMSERGGHAINIYRVEQDSKDEDIYYLKCYDNNFPFNTYVKYDNGKFTREDIDVTIKVVRHRLESQPDTYDFSYDIFKDKSYGDYSEDGSRIFYLTSEIEQIK